MYTPCGSTCKARPKLQFPATKKVREKSVNGYKIKSKLSLLPFYPFTPFTLGFLKFSFYILLFVLFDLVLGKFYLEASVERNNQAVRNASISIDNEKDLISQLMADYSYLANPARIAKLSDEELNLGRVNSKQNIKLEDIPFRNSLTASATFSNSRVGVAFR